MGHDVTIHAIFARHQTFHPRFGWLKKGFDKAVADNEVFSKETAPVILGVGKNMVKAIRYWCIAFNVLEETRVNGKYVHIPSPFAEKLLMDDGWDPFIEDPSSIWLLHWNLFKSPCYAPAWYFTFNELNRIDFSADDLLYSMKEYKNRQFPDSNIADSSLVKDINCLLRMYVEKTGPKTLKEDSLDCPFTQLGIINAYTDSKRFTFNFGNKQSLPPDIIVSTCLEYAASFQNDAKFISISRLLYDAGSPGQAFKLTENSLSGAIETILKKYKGLYLTDTAGMIQFAYDDDPLIISEIILNSYFKKG
ncbi:FIG00856023: hypothetical protein [Olavius sp. associated proteobacterium Delta 1]|nr:FIG00856023: hypothetical protein [Olavius sp. associated proteobacterium Delta 1]